jgi:hypothetical protein
MTSTVRSGKATGIRHDRRPALVTVDNNAYNLKIKGYPSPRITSAKGTSKTLKRAMARSGSIGGIFFLKSISGWGVVDRL